MDWDHPVLRAETAAADGRTTAKQMARALSLEEALKQVAGKDRRPLLVLRECNSCSGTEDALFTRGADNERTYLLSRWFHCVKLPPAVLEETHPFHELFSGDDPSHLFVASWDGQERHDLSGAQSRRELWDAMEKALAGSYAQSPKKPLRSLSKLLDQLDGVDIELWELRARFELALADDGPESRKVKKMIGKLEDLEARRKQLLADVEKLGQLQLARSENRVDPAPTKSG